MRMSVAYIKQKINNMAQREVSIVYWFPELEKHRCGYCKQNNTNCSYGMRAECLTVDDYQNLIDRGWRRSGKYCYKSEMNITCCPLYTIRCEATNFKLSKSQKKIIKRVNRYLSDSCEMKTNEDYDLNMDEVISDVGPRNKCLNKFDVEKFNINSLNKMSDGLEASSDKTVEQSVTNTITASVGINKCKPGEGADPTKPPCKKAKIMRLERKRQKLAAKGITTLEKEDASTLDKTIEEFIDDISDTPAHRLKVRLVLTGGNSKEWTQIRAQEYPIYQKYQMNVHGDLPERCTEKQFTGFLFDSPLQIVLKQMHPKDATFEATANLYNKYQIFVHNEAPHECDVSTFISFLIDTPLQHVITPNGPPCGYGSFHQQYWLDDKLIAVGVIDVLPKCISSVYFFYDPDYRNLTLGTYGSLRELYFTRKLHETVPNIKYYYMGFYIHSCPKMRYKANLYSSYLLCPETYKWFPVKHCIPKLDKQKYSRFNENMDAVDEDRCSVLKDIDRLMILVGYKGCVPYKFYKEKVQVDDSDYLRFGNLIGKKCVPRLFVISQEDDDDF